MSSFTAEVVQNSTSCPVRFTRHTWTAGDKNPSLIMTFDSDIKLITDNLTVIACIERPSPSTTLEKTLVNLTEQSVQLIWDVSPDDLVAGLDQVVTLYVDNPASERTTIGKFTIDVVEPCP